MSLDWIEDFEQYIDFISVVLGYSPDRFPNEDFLPEKDRLHLESSFALLRDRFFLVEERIKRPEVLPEIRTLLDVSYAAYSAGDEMTGAHRIQEFEALILKNARRGRD